MWRYALLSLLNCPPLSISERDQERSRVESGREAERREDRKREINRILKRDQ